MFKIAATIIFVSLALVWVWFSRVPRESAAVAPESEIERPPVEAPTETGGDSTPAKVDVSGGEAQSNDEIDAAAVRALFEKHADSLLKCYGGHPAHSPDGTVMVTIQLDPDGAVSQLSASNDSLSNVELGNCIVAQVTSWTFPKPRTKRVTRINYPIRFFH